MCTLCCVQLCSPNKKQNIVLNRSIVGPFVQPAALCHLNEPTNRYIKDLDTKCYINAAAHSMSQYDCNFLTVGEALYKVKHNAPQKKHKVLNKQNRNATGTNVPVLHCCDSPFGRGPPRTRRAYHLISGRG